MIKEAKDAGADLVKFQLFDAKEDKNKPHYAWVKAHELTFTQAKALFDYGVSIRQEVFFSVFGVEFVKWCEEIGVQRYKIACNYRDEDVLSAVRQTGKPVIISANREIFYWKEASWLYCVPEYPARNIKMPYFNSPFHNKWVGFSDHTLNLDAAKIALVRGAQIIEKHFCLNHKTGIDAEWSMTPEELAELVRWGKVVG